MIELTRLNGHKLTINCDLIRYAESTPDTTLTLVTGEKLIVLETPAEITGLILELRALTLRGAWPAALSALSARAGTTQHTSRRNHCSNGTLDKERHRWTSQALQASCSPLLAFLPA